MNQIVKFRRSRLRFSPEDDSLLLTEVINQNPFENPAIWRTVCENFVAKVGKPFSIRAIKDHVDLLTRRHVHGGKQGESAGYQTEHHSLLNTVVDLIERCKKSKVIKEPRPNPYQLQSPLFMKQNNSMNSTDDNRGELIYLKVECPDNQESMDGMHEEQATYSPAGSDGSAEYTEHEFLDQSNANSHEMTTLEYLKSKHKEEMQMKKRELKMEEKKLALKEKEFNLESQKFELQKWERSKRLEIEMKERELHMKILEQQQQLISMLFEKSNMT